MPCQNTHPYALCTFWKDDYTRTLSHSPKVAEIISKAKKLSEKLVTPLIVLVFQVDCHKADPDLLQDNLAFPCPSVTLEAIILQLTDGGWPKSQG